MFSIKAIFKPNYERYEGVRPINIYLLRLLFLLVVYLSGAIRGRPSSSIRASGIT